MHTKLYYLVAFVLFALSLNNHSCGPKFWEETAEDYLKQPTHSQHRLQEVIKAAAEIFHQEFPHEKAPNLQTHQLESQRDDYQRVLVIMAALPRATSPSHLNP